jgi:hypothetical protein
MLIIGCDFHTCYQQIAMTDGATGELIERRLDNENREANRFYPNLPNPVRVGVEATGRLHWIQRLQGELGDGLGPRRRLLSTRPPKLMNCGSWSPLSLGITPALSLGFTDKCW